MVHEFKGSYRYDYDTVNNWNSTTIGVYYCGVKTADGKLTIYYIGRAVGDDGIRGRLLDHLNESEWDDVTYFGYHLCDTAKEAVDFEAKEIAKYKPRHNTQGV